MKITIVEVSLDHVHILLEILSKFAVLSVVGFLKGKRGLQLYERSPELKFKYRNREFWCHGFYEDTAGKNAVKIANRLKHQLDKDKFGDRLTMFGKM
jgi:putative transposase